MKRHRVILVTSLTLALLGGCATPPKDRFYTLNPVATADPAASRPSYTVTVGLVTVPDVVDRPQLVRKLDANRVEMEEHERWAEPLKSNIGQVIAANLAKLLGGARVAAYPQSASADADYQVAVDVQRFDSGPGATASIEVLWTVRSAKGAVLKAGRSAISEPVQEGDTAALVAAYDRALAAASRDIAQALRAALPAS